MKTLIRSVNRSPLRCGFFTLAIALAWFALSPPLKAQDCDTTCPGGGNTGVGAGALDSVNPGIGINNTAVGANALTADIGGQYNVAVGSGALRSNTTGDFNMAIGAEALANSNGTFNLAIGFRTLFMNINGSRLTAIGAAALRNNTASDNTAIGSTAMRENTTGEFNTSIGANALTQNTTGSTNTAVGFGALTLNTTTSFNVALGDAALGAFNGTTAFDGANTALGSLALTAETSGQENVAVGRRALQSLTDGDNNVAVGWRSGDNLATGSINTLLGSRAGSNYTADESGNICIGSNTVGTAGDFDTIRIGNNLPSNGITISNAGLAVQAFTIGSGLTGGGIQYLSTIFGQAVSIAPNFSIVNGASSCFVGGIFNQTPVAGSHFVVVGNNGKLADATLSSRRFKKDVAPMDKASEGILALKPVTFHWKNDNTNEPEFGLIAEEVAEVNLDWITRDPQGEISGVRYETIPILLLNEFLKEHKKVEEQQASIADLKSTVALQQKEMQVLTAQLKEQAAQIQKVSAQLEASKPAPKVVANP
jgi:trimeric autotransporter adhesin